MAKPSKQRNFMEKKRKSNINKSKIFLKFNLNIKLKRSKTKQMAEKLSKLVKIHIK